MSIFANFTGGGGGGLAAKLRLAGAGPEFGKQILE